MKRLRLFEEFIKENFYDIKVNRRDTETISDADIEDYIDDGYESLTGIVDQFLQVTGYDFNQMKDWSWNNPKDVIEITKKFKIRE
jgi:hypothetical protein